MILRRYLIRELLTTFLAVLAVLVLVYISNRFVRLLADAAAGEIPPGIVFSLLGLKLVENLVLLLPIALYASIILGLGRLHRDREIIAMTAGGFGLPDVVRAVLPLALAFGVLAAGLTLFVRPQVADTGRSLTERAKRNAEVSAVVAGRFRSHDDGRTVFYAEALSPDRVVMHNVFVESRSGRGREIIFARSGRIENDPRTGERFLVLESGHRYRGEPGKGRYVITDFERHGLRLEDGEDATGYRKPETIPTGELLRSSDALHVAELQWRLSMPISTVVLAMLAVPLSRTGPQQGRFARLFAGILVYLLYNNLLNIGMKLIERGELPGTVGMWPVHLVAGVFVLALTLQQAQGRLPWPPRRARGRGAGP